MKNLTDHILSRFTAQEMNNSFHAGVNSRRRVAFVDDCWSASRALYGFTEFGAQPMLTPPRANMKLDKADAVLYGLTLQHYVTSLEPRYPGARRLTVNACPSAGDCIKVCVLDNGHGGREDVQRARKARTHFWTHYPIQAAWLLGFELARAVRKHGRIMFRPNVNSDVEWERLIPDFVNGRPLGDKVVSLGYTKNEAVLDTDGWLGTHYRVAFSFNEKMSDWRRIAPFLNRGGSVSIVTNRKPKTPVVGWRDGVVDADLSDEWIMQYGAIGDLSAKGRARRLIGVSDFVQTIPVYTEQKVSVTA